MLSHTEKRKRGNNWQRNGKHVAPGQVVDTKQNAENAPRASAPRAQNSEMVVDSKQTSQDAPRASAPTHRKQREGRCFQAKFSGRSTRQRIFLMKMDDFERVSKTTLKIDLGFFVFKIDDFGKVRKTSLKSTRGVTEMWPARSERLLEKRFENLFH